MIGSISIELAGLGSYDDPITLKCFQLTDSMLAYDDIEVDTTLFSYKLRNTRENKLKSHILLLLIPDEVLPEVFEKEIRLGLKKSKVVCFASGYNVAFKLLKLPKTVDIILVAPRMIGAGVRQWYLEKRGFLSFIGVHQDVTGNAMKTTLAIAKGIGSTKSGAIEVTFSQEAELDLFSEQAFSPLFSS